MDEIRRIYITGGAGVGKTTLAKKLGAATGFPVHETDWLIWSRIESGERELADNHVELTSALAAEAEWIADGSFVGLAQPLWHEADLIIFLDIPLGTMLWRVFWRHVKAEIRRNNRHPGWINLFKFLTYIARSHQSPEIGDIDEASDEILTQAKIRAKVEQQKHKTLVVKGEPDINQILGMIGAK